ncbi:hypothetical protein BD311DRAFT_752264 [Dichomitus squalens]|uniref:Uncharacterized protein n=1 Tax=Dichomitus squalens TaxID=114155 RepID=A0A4Q9MUW5_9APHY|nr:hypothetical protein BD311DRAFT_752264 [Dichomitus squalens]
MSAESNPWALSGVFLSTGDTFKRHVHGQISASPVPWSLVYECLGTHAILLPRCLDLQGLERDALLDGHNTSTQQARSRVCDVGPSPLISLFRHSLVERRAKTPLSLGQRYYLRPTIVFRCLGRGMHPRCP